MSDTPATVDGRSGRTGRRLPTHWLGVLPFLVYVGVFLLLPTGIVVVGAFVTPQGVPTLANVRALGEANVLEAFRNSIVLSAVSALLGGALGAVLAYVVVLGRPDGAVRRVVTSASGVLAQFGGVTLAFAFLSSVGGTGIVTVLLQHLGLFQDSSGAWLQELTGLIVVYTYFQIPLMVLVFLPALDGIKPQWREASESLGGTSWQYWRHIGIPLLNAPFWGGVLLLFANAFAAYATAAALISQGGIIIPLQIRTALTSETVAGQENVGKALALGMIVVVAIAMSAYTLLQRRASRWLR
ncbi:ABC transporter permease [Spongisporangium articulatum]|uniref:ABC transporter permease n=1 Tax=Spongisporangium articulatum TaxID=3362603 RepID=A0ABW8AGT8_9ACTN